MKKLSAIIAVVIAISVFFAGCIKNSDVPGSSTTEKVETSAESSLIQTETPAQTSSEPVEEDNAFVQAYLDILLADEAAIKAHRIADVGQVAITDIDGDNRPELIYLKDTSDPWPGFYRSGLYIWTCRSEAAAFVFSKDDLFLEVGGGMDYAVLLLQNGELCIYRPSYNEESVYEFKVYGFDGGLLEEKDAFRYSKRPSDDYTSTIGEYRQNETQIDKGQYDALVNQVTQSAESVLMTSFTSPEKYWNLPTVTMTCDEAIAYLRGLAGEDAPESEIPSHSENAEPWRDAYASILRNETASHTIAGNTTTVKFGLPDMDDNGIPELIIYDGYFMSCSVYVYSNGAATLVDTYGGGTSYWAWPHLDGILAQYSGEEEVFWTLSSGKMVQVPFSNSESLTCFDITENNISKHLLETTN